MVAVTVAVVDWVTVETTTSARAVAVVVTLAMAVERAVTMMAAVTPAVTEVWRAIVAMPATVANTVPSSVWKIMVLLWITAAEPVTAGRRPPASHASAPQRIFSV